MNYSVLSSLVNEEVQFVACTFSASPDAYSKRIMSDEDFVDGKKLYTYKTTIKDLKVGDLLIVECIGASSNYGLSIVKVAELNADADLTGDTSYKWAFQKVDTDNLANVIENERALIKEVRALERQAKRSQVLNALKDKGVDILTLTNNSKKDLL